MRNDTECPASLLGRLAQQGPKLPVSATGEGGVVGSSCSNASDLYCYWIDHASPNKSAPRYMVLYGSIGDAAVALSKFIDFSTHAATARKGHS
jgi:hypothetical protein